MRYFKRRWDDFPIGRDDWGCSWWYLEADDAGVVVRQIEVYDSGPTLRYDRIHVHDQFGMLADQPLDLKEFSAFEIPQEQFQTVWESDTDIR